jgi:hypothetical protein
MVEIWDGLGLNRVRHAPRHVIARWPRVKYLGSGTSESTAPTRCTTGCTSHWRRSSRRTCAARPRTNGRTSPPTARSACPTEHCNVSGPACGHLATPDAEPSANVIGQTRAARWYSWSRMHSAERLRRRRPHRVARRAIARRRRAHLRPFRTTNVGASHMTRPVRCPMAVPVAGQPKACGMRARLVRSSTDIADLNLCWPAAR